MMKNMGPKSTEWLASVGIHTLDAVAQLGVVGTYTRVKAAYPDKVSLNRLWGLQAALLDLPCAAREVPPGIPYQGRIEEAGVRGVNGRVAGTQAVVFEWSPNVCVKISTRAIHRQAGQSSMRMPTGSLAAWIRSISRRSSGSGRAYSASRF
jgi:hypothetical protein